MHKLQFSLFVFGVFTFALTNGGVVSPITDCGAGTTLEVRVTDCTVPPCQLEAGKMYAFEADFIPNNTCEELGFQIMIAYNSTSIIWAGNMPGYSVIGGEAYTFLYPDLTPDSELIGATVFITTQITCVATGVGELCVQAHATIV